MFFAYRFFNVPLVLVSYYGTKVTKTLCFVNSNSPERVINVCMLLILKRTQKIGNSLMLFPYLSKLMHRELASIRSSGQAIEQISDSGMLAPEPRL